MGYAEGRLDLLERLRSLAAGRAFADAFVLDKRALRFHLGTSIADLRVPVATDPLLADTFAVAALDLLYLLCIRHRSALRDGDWDQLLLLDGFEPRNGRPASFSAPVQVKSESVRLAFTEAPELHPALDSGIIAGWITQGRPGRVLLSTLNGIFRRSRAESGDKEPTAYLALLALRGLAEPTLGALRGVSLPSGVNRAFGGAVATGLYLAARLAAREAGVLEGTGSSLVEAALSPLPWLAGGRQVAGSLVSAWGVAFPDLPPRIEILAQRVAGGAASPAIVREALADLAASKDAARRAERIGALAAARASLLDAVRLVESGRAPSIAQDGLTLSQLYSLPGALERVLAAADRRKDLVARAKAAAKGCASELARDGIERLVDIAKAWREEEPSAGWLGMTEAHDLYANGACALAVDLAIARGVEKAATVVLHRDGTESEGGLEQEFESGKLYRLAVDERPILMLRPTAPQLGHLFCDVKDFTRRTAFLKETVVADFLSREFYTPILTAAARHHHGATHLGDKGGIYLNNLLGDAVSFAGDVVALVALTHDIRAALHNYERRLDAESSSEAVARSAASIEQRSAARRQELEAALAAARAAQAGSQGDPATDAGARQRALLAELARLEDERESELALARGEKLEAGIFISFGAAPEVATFEDAVFGAIKVAIAEKINESARGTARSGGVRARIDSLVAQARHARGRPDLTCPFHVLIGQSLSIPVSPETEAAVRLALRRGEAGGAEALLGEGVRALLAKLAAEQPSEAFGDIYNGGAALSEEALRAYVAARGGEILFLEREVPVAQLHATLRDRFVFPMSSLKLVAAVSEQGPALHELYVHAGRALFKGLEKTGGLGVYELVAPRSAFATLIAQHHLAAWLREEKEGAPPASDPWQARQVAFGRPPRTGGGP
ncbi:MAG: hypothetical protein NVS4B10_09430 [Myxococcales bacterium]